MKPTKKAPGIEGFLNALSGRTEAIQGNRCADPPFGCGKEIIITQFRNEISLKEYRISGLCQECQDKVFGKD